MSFSSFFFSFFSFVFSTVTPPRQREEKRKKTRMTTPFSLSPSPSPFPSPSPSPSPSEDEKPGWYPFLGLFIYILGTILMSGGVNIQKFALNKAKKRCEERGEKVHGGWKSPLWFLGLTCYIFAGIFLSVALYFATPALVTPFMSVVLISNLIFAHFLLGEPLTKKDGIAISIVIVGLIVTAVTAPEDSQVHKSKDLIGFYKEIPFIIFASLICLCLIVLIVLNILLQKQVRNCIIPSKEMEPWKLFMYPFSFASLAGIFGGTTVLIMKSAIEIIVEKMSHGFVPFISSWFMYVLVLLMGFFWSMQMFWLNRGLKYFHAVCFFFFFGPSSKKYSSLFPFFSFSVPSFSPLSSQIYIVSLEAVINELVAVVGSIIYFQEYNEKNFTTVKKVFFCVGMSIGVFGVLLLAYWRREFDDDPICLI